MAVPKKKTSVSRKGKRRAGQHHKLYAKTPMVCPNCNSITMPHNACPSCGTYKKKEIFTLRDRSKSEEEAAEVQS